MGKVATTYKLMPENPEVNLEDVLSVIKSKMNVGDFKIEPIAFGLKSLSVMIVTEDSDGGIDDLETILNELEGISEVTVVSSTLI
jgi:translation elongation factor aEF-1 beta